LCWRMRTSSTWLVGEWHRRRTTQPAQVDLSGWHRFPLEGIFLAIFRRSFCTLCLGTTFLYLYSESTPRLPDHRPI
jgi:hypothetical protein